MKNYLIVKMILAMFVIFSFGFAKETFADETVPGETVLPSSIVLNSNDISIQKGNTFTLKSTIVPSDAQNQEVTWKSNNTNIATVSETGEVKGVSAGKTSIVVTSVANPSVTSQVNVTVTPILPTKISVNKTSLHIANGQKYLVKATVAPTNAENKKVKWTTSNAKIATVSSEGLITAKANGNAVISATAVGNEKLVTTIKVNVSTKTVKANKSSLTLVSGKSSTVKAIVSPSDATQKSVTWSTSNSKIASVSSKGTIKAKKPGTVTITAKAKSAKSAKIKVVVKAPVQAKSVSINKTNFTLGKGSSAQLVAAIKPSNTTYKKISWSSSNSKIVKVDQNGKVTAVGLGTATIKAKTVNGKYKTVKVKVVLKAAKKTLTTGSWVVGKDLNPGFYDVTTSDSNGGNLIVTRGKYDLVVNEILTSENGEFGVSKATAEFKKGDKIQIMNLKNATFTPAKRGYRSTLHAGRWVAGKDIRPGRYTATVINGSGNLIIKRGEYNLVVNEILSTDPEFGVKKVTFTLKSGDDIEIMGINGLKFTKL
ncbi:Ig-like domain-containing protein [Rummeliibacillus pycnus]|uniref:Ig-like domain-containing protein n=1 Tax=Rummeliibacillus pycnus TaxID=101070 RepID=UPI003D2A43B5